MRDDLANNQLFGVECVYLSLTERFQIDCFIGQYINTRNLHSVPDISDVLRSTLGAYCGTPPIMVNELNAWIDKTLGYRAFHPDFAAMDDL
ncbi:hypothetical protein SAMN04489798_3820 [Pseudomonas arsenicoxydans]|uniref:Uncharacterized protein n=1 Tax=Pseudomonas arsenicoxydans TaxID=702115 RepID=A0A1H0MAY4_9PSED|nr:hypothetical protein [Pseudomonas arsenicoxydans]SDO77495.1 hypothetical protein SAMN04489798_3820 [Pseudomonas arsenicoxydans]